VHDWCVSNRRVLVVVYDGVQSLDVTGPVEVFAHATRLGGDGRGGYDLVLASVAGGAVRTSSGLRLWPDRALRAARGPLDTLLVAGGDEDGVVAAVADTRLVGGVRRLASQARRVASVCSGAFVLAEAGLLDGRRATTHWSACDVLASAYPAVRVDPEPIYVRDEEVWTSAGVTAGIDLALSMVEDDMGRDVALAVARQLVVFLHRPANQAQFSAQLAGQLAERDALRQTQHWIADHPDADLTVEALARRAAMSPRNFARSFRAELGMTPARYVERVRVEAARRLLEESKDPVEAVARRCGFGTGETLRRTFLRALGVGPLEYRRRFRTAS
jgi:transcriptional regulator GlxA family with amidase domain